TTAAGDDAAIADIDPDWPHSWYSIRPGHELPQVVGRVTIDGDTQPGSQRNTLPSPQGLNTILKIELAGTNATGSGLRLTRIGSPLSDGDSSVSRIEGLAVNQWSGDGIVLDNLGGDVIAGVFVGTDVSGTLDLGNRGFGVSVTGNFTRIGGVDADQ